MVLRHIVRSPATLYTLALMLVLNVSWTIRGTFWSILVSQELRIPDEHLALYPFVRSMTMLAFFFVAMPRLQRMAQLSQFGERLLMIIGFVGLLISQVILIAAPVGSYTVLLIATMLEGTGIPLTGTMLDKLTVTTVDAKERARTMALLNLMVVVGATPFGWIAGQLSLVNRRLPFVLVLALLILGGFVALLSRRVQTPVVISEAEHPLEAEMAA